MQVTLGVLGLAAFNAAAANAYIYWTVSGVSGNGGTMLGRADLDASGITHSFVSGLSDPSVIAVDGSYIYWSNYATNSIGRANLNGTGSDPSWIPNVSPPASGLAVDGSYIYWTDGRRYVGRATIGGDDINEQFIDVGAGSDPEGLAVEAGTLYIGALQQIMEASATGGVPIPLGASVGSDEFVPSLAAVGNDLYYGLFSAGAGSIGRMTVDGEDPTTVVDDLQYPGGIASDGTYLYWTDAGAGEGSNVIGRGLIDAGGLINVTPDFISEPNWPLGIAVDGGIDPTTTTISCVPSTLSVGQQSACTATVADSASTSVPTGTVNFSGSGGAFFLGNPCTLAPNADGGASCTLGAELTTAGTQTITTTYSGNPVHEASSASTTLCAGTATQCGGKPPPPPPAALNCTVPKLKGKTLTQAGKLLKAAHCKLGKVTKPKVKKGHKQGKLVVGSSKPGAGARLTDGAKVAIKLVAAPKKRHKRR
jgi:hypothetical protein